MTLQILLFIIAAVVAAVCFFVPAAFQFRMIAGVLCLMSAGFAVGGIHIS